jgi:4-carboxymuconolactone decarboxylase
MSPRIEPLRDPRAEVREALAKTIPRGGEPLNIFTTLAHHPRLMRRLNVLAGLFVTHGLLPVRERELVILRVGWRRRAEYEFGQHTLIAREAGLSEEEVARVCRENLEGWSPDDADLLRLADEVVDLGRVRDGTWDRLSARFPAPQMLELVALAGFYVMVSAILTSVGVERDPGVPGWPPDAEAPRSGNSF